MPPRWAESGLLIDISSWYCYYTNYGLVLISPLVEPTSIAFDPLRAEGAGILPSLTPVNVDQLRV